MAEQISSLRVAGLEKRLRTAALLVCLGLLTLLLTLVRIHPLAFVAFTVIGCPLVLAGIVLFLYSVVSHSPEV
jgi:hypothetical protein